MANYKLPIIAGLAAATAAGLINACEPAKQHYNKFNIDEYVRTEEIAYRANDARATAQDLIATAETRVENGVLAARYGNSSNLGDIAFAGAAIGLSLAGLTRLGRKLQK